MNNLSVSVQLLNKVLALRPCNLNSRINVRVELKVNTQRRVRRAVTAWAPKLPSYYFTSCVFLIVKLLRIGHRLTRRRWISWKEEKKCQVTDFASLWGQWSLFLLFWSLSVLSIKSLVFKKSAINQVSSLPLFSISRMQFFLKKNSTVFFFFILGKECITFLISRFPGKRLLARLCSWDTLIDCFFSVKCYFVWSGS